MYFEYVFVFVCKKFIKYESLIEILFLSVLYKNIILRQAICVLLNQEKKKKKSFLVVFVHSSECDDLLCHFEFVFDLSILDMCRVYVNQY